MHNLVAKHCALDNVRNMRDSTRSYRPEENELYVYRTNAASAIFLFFFSFCLEVLLKQESKKAIKRGNRE